MKPVLHSLILIILLSLLVACGKEAIKGNGNIATQTRNLPTFERIKAEGALNVLITVNEGQSVSVRTDDNLQPYIITTVKNHTLDIGTKKDYRLTPTQPIQLVISLPALRAVSLLGGISAKINGINDKYFGLYAAGNSQVVALGEIEKASISVAGTSLLDAQNLIAGEVNLDASGSGKAIVYVKNKLDVKISGSGHVVYYGKPPIIHQAVFGAGKIEHAP